jgi:Kdo2-lipid IVA lauroyltransferase/acyltransferase
LKFLLRLLARLPLGVNHAVGAFLGRLVYAFPGRYRSRTLDNLAASGLCATPEQLRQLGRANAAEIGKGVTELAWALFRPLDEVTAVVKGLTGWEAVEKLRAEGRPIVFVTPHLGGFDVAGRYLWTHLPILAMYRPHKIFWLDQLLREGRNRPAADA